MVEFGDDLPITYVMGGLAREIDPPYETRLLEWLEHSDRSAMPVDPLLWYEGPIRSTYPACMAVKAAGEQGPEAAGRYLRALREGLMCFRRKLDSSEALVEEARRAGLDAARFRIGLESNATLEAFGGDLDLARGLDPDRFTLPSYEIGSEVLFGAQSYDGLREAALAAGARPSGAPAPDVLGALERFGRMAGVEVEAVCGLAAPPANAELWRLAAEWRVKPVRVLTGMLWELARR
jgi:putative protein-disulfide isomerase